MQNSADLQADRRQEPRSPTAFALWIDRPTHADPISAWAVNLSVGGAAFLIDADDVPCVGERLVLRVMPIKNRWVAARVPSLPRWGRVLRVEISKGLTRKFAIRFESEISAPRVSCDSSVTTVRATAAPSLLCGGVAEKSAGRRRSRARV